MIIDEVGLSGSIDIGDDDSVSMSLDYPITVSDVASYSAAEAAALAYFPATYAGRIFKGLKGDDVEPANRDGLYKFVGRYSFDPAEDEDDEEEVSISELGVDVDIRPVAKHVTHSLDTVQSKFWTGSGTPPDFKGGINVDPDGKVQGVDLGAMGDAAITFSIQQEFLTSALTNAFFTTLEGKVGRVNSGTFRGRAAGEVYFAGVRGSIRYAEIKNTLTYDFAISKNATSLTVGEISGLNKKGWEYLWVYSDRLAEAGGRVVPIAAYVEKVFETTSFAGMGVST